MTNASLNAPTHNDQVGKALTSARRLRWSALTYPQKFTVVAIIFALPLLAFTPLIADRFTRIENYGHKELRGTLYLREVWQLRSDIQLFHSRFIKYENGTESPEKINEAQAKVEADFTALKAAGDKYNLSLDITFDFNKLQAQWNTLKNGVQAEVKSGAPSHSGETTHDQEQSILDANFGLLVKEIGNKSYLILDPDLDTYYMMDTVLIKLPENQTLIFELWHLTEKAINDGGLTPAELFEVNSLIGLIENNILVMEENIQTAVQNNSSGLMDQIVSVPFQGYLRETRSFTVLIRKNISESQSIQLDSQTADLSFTKAINASNIFYQAASQSLESGIQARINSSNLLLYLSIIFAILSVIAAFTIGLRTMRAINRPLLGLINATEKLAAGQMDTRIAVTSTDEVGRASLAFNKMAEDMESARVSLRARAGELEQRSVELETIAEVAREITIIHDLSTLLNVAANLIRERFKYYHVGIFMIDDKSQYAHLRAASSVAAQQMLDQKYKLKIGQEGLVGNVIKTGTARIAQDVGKDAVHFQNPFLPQTHSEITLPLRSRNITIGALDIQTNTEAAFGERDINVLQLLADQLAAAIENAQLTQQVEGTFKELNSAYRSQTQNVWISAINKRELTAYEYDGVQILAIPQDLPGELVDQLKNGKSIIVNENNDQPDTKKTLFVPIMVRNQVIGVVGLEQEDSKHRWSEEEIAVAEAAANRAGLTLENVRLLEESQRRAGKERAIFEATTRIGAALNMENILHATAEELERVLGNSEVILQFNDDKNS